MTQQELWTGPPVARAEGSDEPLRFAAPEQWWGEAEHAPRAWQDEALYAIMMALGAEEPTPCIVQAVMGAGKSLLIAEIVAAAILEPTDVVVVTTTNRHLVDQLFHTLGKRLGYRTVGRFFSEAKEAIRPVLIACVPSAPKLAHVLRDMGRRCVLWIADEAHRTECDTIHLAHQHLAPRHAVGFTATPYRSLRTEELSLWTRLVYEYGPREALRDGVVVPWKVVGWTGRECSVDDACLDMVKRARELGPGMVNALTVNDAEGFAQILRNHDIAAAAVHSRMTREAITDRLHQLETGTLEVIVHVSMLQEGVDLPWLRWLCLRRPSPTRVRFAQEIGRVLRAAPGKREAVIYDPHDLFGSFKLNYEATLQGAAEPGGDTAERAPRHPAAEAAEAVLEPSSQLGDVNATPLGAFGSYLRQLTIALDLAGLVDRKVASAEWRELRPTAKQIHFARSLMGRIGDIGAEVPEPHRSAMRQVCRVHARLTRGQISDLITILLCILRQKAWPDLHVDALDDSH